MSRDDWEFFEVDKDLETASHRFKLGKVEEALDLIERALPDLFPNLLRDARRCLAPPDIKAAKTKPAAMRRVA